MIPHDLRPMRPSDAGFVYDSWLGSLADELGVDRSTGTAMRDFKRMMRPTLARVIEDRRTTTTVACARNDADAILGWVCAEPPGVLHFVYVQKSWRKGGFAKALLAGIAPGAKATHYTSWGFPHVARVIPGLEFDPMLLIGDK